MFPFLGQPDDRLWLISLKYYLKVG